MSICWRISCFSLFSSSFLFQREEESDYRLLLNYATLPFFPSPSFWFHLFLTCSTSLSSSSSSPPTSQKSNRPRNQSTIHFLKSLLQTTFSSIFKQEAGLKFCPIEKRRRVTRQWIQNMASSIPTEVSTVVLAVEGFSFLMWFNQPNQSVRIKICRRFVLKSPVAALSASWRCSLWIPFPFPSFVALLVKKKSSSSQPNSATT